MRSGDEPVWALRGVIAVLGLVLTTGAASARDLPEVVASGELRVLAVPGSEVFFNLDSGGSPGLDREILEGFARLHGVKVVPVEVESWERLIPSLVEGRGDVAAGGVTVTEARRRVVSFTREVFPTRYVVVTRQPHRGVSTVEQLREERVGTIRGTSLAEVVAGAGIPAAQIDDGIASGGLPSALTSGRVTAVVLGIEDALITQRDDDAFQVGVALGPAGALAFGVSQDAPELRAALDEYLGNLRRTPTWNRLAVEYFGEDAVEILRRAREE
jgi:ABC-type amino acid transport substrate-binding protein